MSQPRLAIILPCYNEAEALPGSWNRLKPYFAELILSKRIDSASRICFVDDGSHDSTWSTIEGLCALEKQVQGIKLSRNFGHQGALLAGLSTLQGQYDCYVTIDADLQDDIQAIGKMVDAFVQGSDVVYGVREDRSEDSFFKRVTAEGFYRVMAALGVKTIFNHADFRLISQRVLVELLRYPEKNLFLRSMFPLIGFPSSAVNYKRVKREAGETKYPLRKMLSFAWNGVSAFSTKPIRAVLFLGVWTFILSMVFIVWSLFNWTQGHVVPGWTSTVLPIALFSALQMISLGVIGEYIGKIYVETKQRPLFIVEQIRS
jgi:glycosyltransferase involved in cell wall biosynthesis